MKNRLGSLQNSIDNAATILSYVTFLYQKFDIEQADVDVMAINKIAESMEALLAKNPDNKYENAAAFIALFVKISPVKTALEQDKFPVISEIPNHQNSMVALLIASDYLDRDDKILDHDRANDLLDAISLVDFKQIKLLSLYLEELLS